MRSGPRSAWNWKQMEGRGNRLGHASTNQRLVRWERRALRQELRTQRDSHRRWGLHCAGILALSAQRPSSKRMTRRECDGKLGARMVGNIRAFLIPAIDRAHRGRCGGRRRGACVLVYRPQGLLRSIIHRTQFRRDVKEREASGRLKVEVCQVRGGNHDRGWNEPTQTFEEIGAQGRWVSDRREKD